MFELNVIEDVVLTYCHGIVISAVLGRNSQNKPNVFSFHVVLRSGAEMRIQYRYANLSRILQF